MTISGYANATSWDEITSPATTITPTAGKELLIVCVSTETIGDTTNVITGCSSSLDGALQQAGAAVSASGGNENRVAIFYKYLPTTGSAHNISFTYANSTPGDVYAHAFTLDAAQFGGVRSSGTDSGAPSSGTLTVASLSHTAADYGVAVSVHGGVGTAWTADATWVLRLSQTDASSLIGVQTEDYASAGTDTVDFTLTGTPTREAMVAVIFKGEAGAQQATYNVDIDLNEDGGYGDAGEDVTSDVTPRGIGGRRAEGQLITATRGRETQDRIGFPRAGLTQFTLNNDGDLYDPGDALDAGQILRCQATYSGTTYDLWAGDTAAPQQNPVLGAQQVIVKGRGRFARLGGLKISTGLLEGVRVDEAIEEVLTTAGFSASEYTLDTSPTTLTYWWLKEADAAQAIRQLVLTDGPGAVFYEDGTGDLIFKARDAIINESRSTAVQATFTTVAGGAEPQIDRFQFAPLVQSVVNDVRIVSRRRELQPLAVVWQFGGTLTLGASETVTIDVSATNPFKAAVSPLVADTDYVVTGGSITSATLNRTHGQAAALTITAGAGSATVTGLQVRAQALTNVGETVALSTDATSQGKYGQRSLPGTPWREVSFEQQQAIADGWKYFRANPRRRVVFDLLGGPDAARMTQALAREINDRVQVQETNTSLTEDFYVTALTYNVTSPAWHKTTFYAEEASDDDVFLVDTDALGDAETFWI